MAYEKRNDGFLYALLNYEDFDDAPRHPRVIQLIREGHHIRRSIEEADKRLKEIKAELSQIQLSNHLPGFRYGKLCFIATEKPGKLAVNKDKLMEHGVKGEVIAASMERGKPYVQCEFEVIGEAK